jgi:ABC-type branched-subunit amino acid transport system substrate-binding protein
LIGLTAPPSIDDIYCRPNSREGGFQMGRVLGAIAIGSLLAAGIAAPAAAKLNSCDGPIVLGTTMSLTGINSTLAGRWDKMTDAFEKEINKSGGVFVSSCNKKLPIKFVYYDDQSIAATAVSLYEKLATVDNVDLFVGPDWSTHGFPVSQIFEKYKIPSVMSNVATPKVYESGFKYIAGIALDATTWSKNYFDMLGQLTPKPASIFWIVQDNLVTKAVQETNVAHAEKAGIKTVGSEVFAGTTKNFTGLILKIKSLRPDIIYISSFDAVSVPLIQQMRQLQVQAMDVHHIMASGSLARQADLEGVTGEIYWHEGIRGPYSDLAIEVLKQADIKIFDYLWTGGRMDSYLVMLQAIERAGAVDREKVAAELRKPGAVWKRPGGDFKFNDGGLSQIVAYTHQMQKGEPVVVWPSDQATGKLAWPSPNWK